MKPHIKCDLSVLNRRWLTRVLWVSLLAFCLFLLVVAVQSPGVAAPDTVATIEIDASKIENPISPMLYGQFAEFMFEDIKGGLYAELIRDRSFEEAPDVIRLPRYWERYPDDRNDDFALNFGWDESVFYPVPKSDDKTMEHSLRVEVAEGVIKRHGIYQSRIPVRQGIEYSGYLWAKATSFKGRLMVALERDITEGEKYAEAAIDAIEGDWKKYRFTLKPSKSDPLARFAVLFEGHGVGNKPGILWIDQVSLMPGDAVHGVRLDVFERIKALEPAFVRWPGGNVAQDYHWMWGVGPRDRRPTWINLSWKNEPEPSDFGTDEYIQFCDDIGAEPSITVNVEGRGATIEEAAAWVEYCNGPVASKYGALRASHGHPRPYNVKYWEIGNEIWGSWVRGHSDAPTYARNFNRYYTAMRAVDPTIKFIGCGDNNMDWNRQVLRVAGRNMDYLAVHHYYGTGEMHGDPLNLMARPLFYESFYQQVGKLIGEVVPDHKVKLAINEWNTSLPEARQHSMESALYAARLMNVFERSGELVQMSAVSDLVNGWPGGIIQASRHGVFVTPTYLVNLLYAENLGTQRLSSKVSSPTFSSNREGKGVPYLDVVTSRSSDGSRIFVKMVNSDTGRALTTTIRVRGARPAPRAEIATVGSIALSAANSFSAPNSVSIEREQIPVGPEFTILLPRHSVSVITLQVSP